jgi:hypothetical protein
VQGKNENNFFFFKKSSWGIFSFQKALKTSAGGMATSKGKRHLVVNATTKPVTTTEDRLSFSKSIEKKKFPMKIS